MSGEEVVPLEEAVYGSFSFSFLFMPLWIIMLSCHVTIGSF